MSIVIFILILLLIIIGLALTIPLKIPSSAISGYPLLLILCDLYFPKVIKTFVDIEMESNVVWDYKYYIKEKTLSIGCINMTIPEWTFFFSNKCTDVYQTERNTFQFWLLKKRYKQMLKAIQNGKN